MARDQARQQHAPRRKSSGSRPLPTAQANSELRVPLRLGKPHPLVEQARQVLEQAPADDYGRLIPKSICLNIWVAKASLPRALRIMDGLLKALEANGYQTSLEPKGWGGKPYTKVVVEGQDIELSLFEAAKRLPQDVPPEKRKSHVYYPNWIYKPSGVLTLEIGGRYATWSGLKRRWSDTGRQQLEEQLGGFLDAIRLIAQAKRESEEKCARDRAAQAEAAQRAAEIRRQREMEEQRVQALQKVVTDWQQSQLMQAFARHVRQSIPVEAMNVQLEEWLTWAEAQAQRLDPAPTIIERALAGQYPLHLEEPKTLFGS